MDKIRAYFANPQQSKLLRLIILAIILIALPLIVIVAQQQQEVRQRASENPLTPSSSPSRVILELHPDSSPARLGEPFSVDLTLFAGTYNITGVDIIMNFNESILSISSFTPGTQFNSELINNIDRGVGSFRYAATNTNPSVEITDGIKIGTFTLEPKLLGEGQLNFLSTQITAFGQTDAVSASATNGTYYISTPQPTVPPTATTIPTNTPVPPTPTIQPTAIPSPTPTSAPLLGDANGDSTVDILDYNIWRDEFLSVNPLGGGGFRSDFNTDGRVDLLDFNIWRTAFGSTPTASPTSNPSPTTVSQAKRVFVTSTSYNGNLGGLAGADAKCQERANAATLGGTWKAWLSDSTTSAGSRLTHSSVPYELVNGTVVADNWADLTDGNIQNPINITEGNQRYFGIDIWTYTDYDGNSYDDIAINSSTCNNWSSSASEVFGRTGFSSSQNMGWTWTNSLRCSNSYSLYCFEQ